MARRNHIGLLGFAALLLWLTGCTPAGSPQPSLSDELMVGVKIYDYQGSFDDLFAAWAPLGINTAFVSETLAANATFRQLARDHGIDTFVIAPVFFNPEALEQDPDLFAVTADGHRAQDDWVQFVCPSRKTYREKRVQELVEWVRRLRPDGLSLDFIRHFVFWEMVDPETRAESLPNTCFCPHCLASFSTKSGVEIPDVLRNTEEIASWILAHHEPSWTTWKIDLITSMVEEIVREIRKVDPTVKVNIHAVPWRRDDYAGAIRRVAAQDFTALSALADYLSPMCYSFMLERPPEWIHSVVQDLDASSTAAIIPSIQVKESYREDERLGEEEFDLCLREALKPPSQGVVFWSWNALAQEPDKQSVIRQVLTERDRG